MQEGRANSRVTAIGPRAGMAPQAFHAHWSGPHAEIAKDLPGLIYYVQNHVLRGLWEGGGAENRFLGVAEVKFAEPDRLLDTIASWPRRHELQADEARFLGARVGHWAVHPATAPAIGHRRIVVLLSGAEADAVADTVSAISATAPCHAEPVLGGDAGAFDWILFVELSPEGAGPAQVRQILSAEGPILRHVTRLRGPSLAYLTATQVNRLPFDRM